MKFLLITVLGLSVFMILQFVGSQTVNGILVGDGREESDLILVGKVVSFTENQIALDTDYVVEVEEYLKFPKNFDTTKHIITITSPGLRQYDDPQKEVVYGKIFNVGDRVLFLLYQKDNKLRESLWSLTTKSSCTPKQLLDEMYGPSGLSISQNNQTKYLYTNRPVDLAFFVYNVDLKSEKKDFEFQIFTPNGKLSEKRQVHLQECKRSAEVKWSFVPTIPGKYTFNAIIGNNEGGGESYGGISIENYVESPLKQFKSGIPAQAITCKQGLQSIMKINDGSPACVKPSTASRLIELGWGEPTIIIEKGWIDRSK